MPRNLLRRFDQFRRRVTGGVSAWLYGLLGHDRFLSDERLEPDQIRRILVLRNNKRIGNMYFLLPFLHALRQTYPAAVIDLMVISESHAKIFEGLGLGRIWVSNFSFASLPSFARTMLQCRSDPYDLLLMPHPSSTDTIIGGLIHARNKVSFWRTNTIEVYPHSIHAQDANVHAAFTPLALLSQSDVSAPSGADHRMALSAQEQAKARALVAQFKARNHICIAYFRGARGKKIIPDSEWLSIRQRFDATLPNSITWIEILSPDIQQALVPDTPTWQSADLRELGAFLAACDLFICADTGPLHLADAANARCVGLFTATSPEHYGCMGPSCVNVTDIKHLDAQAILSTIQHQQDTTPNGP
jgi:ADP-heptose:LPS heptosyltransferase